VRHFIPVLLTLISLPTFGQLTATFTSNGVTQTRPTTLPALYVAEGSSPTAGLPSGPFTATFTGTLEIPKRYRVYFSVESEGTVALKVDGEDAPFTDGKSERIRLNPGAIPIEITFTSTDKGSGFFRLYWEERREFPREPIPNAAFVASQSTAVDPVHLFTSQNCVQCHDYDFGASSAPELKDSGPNLAGIGSRASQEWLTRWIAQPDLLKPTTTMPAMVDHTKPEGAQAAADLAAYLATLTGEKPSGDKPDLKLAQKGGEHFHNLGCVACHSKPDAAEPDFENGRVPLNNVATKYKGGALVDFLKNPSKHHASIKMPDFRFSDEEANSLAAYLTKTSTGNHTPDPSEFPPGDAARGMALSKSLNCASCHEGLEAAQGKGPNIYSLKDWSAKGCLGPDEKRGKAPRLNLKEEEKKSLTPAILPLLKNDTAAAFATRQIESLNCASCHQYNGKEALLTLTHAETKSLLDHIKEHDERLIQSRPPLTHMGVMLQSTYLKEMLLGTADPRPRPWLDMRMPAFSHRAEGLTKGLAHHHGLPESKPSEKKADPSLAATGEKLVGMTGYACVTCHAINDKKALAAFEVKGINFGLTHQRLREDYFHQWMFNPLRLVPDTKMPRYTNPDDGTGLRADILEGDSKKQFEAIWEYLKSVDK
jgi:mono/diheme cytochrome c family protein